MRAAVLFSGIGAWELAAEQIGIHTVWAAEWNEWKAVRYAERFPNVTLYRDVRALTGQEMIRRHGPIDVLLGSPPCTDISSANHKARGLDGAASRHYFEAIRLVAELRPRWAAFENSDKLRTRGADRVLSFLERNGYACWPVVVGAVHAGAPHRRLRSFIVAADADALRLREQPRRRRGARGQGSSVSPHDAHANGQGQPDLPLYGEMGWGAGTNGADRRGQSDGNPDRPGLAVGQGVCRNNGAQQPPTQRATHVGWGDRSASLARHIRVADGVPAGICSKWRSAFGDAVVVNVARAVLHGIISADAPHGDPTRPGWQLQLGEPA